MIYPNPKKVASIIVNKMKPEGGYSEGGEVKSEESMQPELHGMHSAMEDFLSAMGEKSPIGMHEALGNWLTQYKVNEPMDATEQDKKFTKEHDYEYSYPEK